MLKKYDGSAMRYLRVFAEFQFLILTIFRNALQPDLLNKEKDKLNIIDQIDHQNIIKFHSFDLQPEKLVIYMEHAQIDQSTHNQPFLFDDSPKAQQVKSGIQTLAQHGIVYSKFDQNSVLIGDDGFYKIFNFESAFLIDPYKGETKYQHKARHIDFGIGNQYGDSFNQFNEEENYFSSGEAEFLSNEEEWPL